MSAVVKNAADPKQVGRARKLEKQHRDRELDDLRAILATDAGRRFLWRIIGHCKVFGSIWSQNAMVHYNAGQQDVGHWLLAEITEADEARILQMMQENFAAAKLERQQTEAERTPRAEDVTESEGDEQ